MKTEHLVIAILILAMVYFLYKQGCSLTFRCTGPKEGYSATGICSDAASNGADSAFVESCKSYQKVCGEDSTSVAVHNISGEYGLNSDQADSSMAYLVSNVNAQKCCNPSNPDAENCTGN
jgi:hypothetical protein